MCVSVLHDGPCLWVHLDFLRILQSVPMPPPLRTEVDGYFGCGRSAIAGPHVADDTFFGVCRWGDGATALLLAQLFFFFASVSSRCMREPRYERRKEDKEEKSAGDDNAGDDNASDDNDGDDNA